MIICITRFKFTQRHTDKIMINHNCVNRMRFHQIHNMLNTHRLITGRAMNGRNVMKIQACHMYVKTNQDHCAVWQYKIYLYFLIHFQPVYSFLLFDKFVKYKLTLFHRFMKRNHDVKCTLRYFMGRSKRKHICFMRQLKIN